MKDSMKGNDDGGKRRERERERGRGRKEGRKEARKKQMGCRRERRMDGQGGQRGRERLNWRLYECPTAAREFR